jgi:L-threonylcarbamoyladenylate synthase
VQIKSGTDIHQAVTILSAGGLVAIPTETVYGLAANALNAHAALKIFEAKKRPSFDPLIVHISSLKEIYRYASVVPPAAVLLAEKFWPGPLTLVLPKQDLIPDVISSGLSTVGLRVPNHPLTLELLSKLPFPLAAPSANPFGYISPTTAKHVEDQLGDAVDYILDGGPCRVGVESTIVGFEEDVPVVFRLGGLTVEDIRTLVPEVMLKINASSNPQAPGMLASHYAPRKRFVLGKLSELLAAHSGEKLGILSFKEMVADGENIVQQEVLSPAGDLFEAAAELFAAMRRLDTGTADLILAETVPDVSIGRAINDRLRRAAG